MRGLPDTLFKDRDEFERVLDAAIKKAGLKLPAPAKAILSALSERDETAAICRDEDGNPEPDPELRDTESVPLSESVEAFFFFEREVKPHVPDAWIDTDKARPEGRRGRPRRLRDQLQPLLLPLHAAPPAGGDRGRHPGDRDRHHADAGGGDLANLPPLADPDLFTVAARIPKAVVAVVSALHFHGLTTEIPHEVSIALPRGTARPKLEWPPLRVYRFSGAMYRDGIEVHERDGAQLRVYGVAKTIADCFRFRNRLGIELPLEALRTAVHERKVTPAEIQRAARHARVEAVVRPYLESLQ